jgi:hypothetical protein
MIMERSWFWRRWAVFSSLIVCDAVIVYLTLFGEDTRLNQDIANGALLLIAALVNGYVFGGMLDDRFKGKEKLASQAVDQSEPTETNVEIKS